MQAPQAIRGTNTSVVLDDGETYGISWLLISMDDRYVLYVTPFEHEGPPYVIPFSSPAEVAAIERIRSAVLRRPQRMAAD